MEEAVHVLRSLPPKAWVQYAVGTVPFGLALLYFFADISRGAYGHAHLAPGALIMALLYLWLKFWQGAFSRSLAAILYGREQAPWTIRRIWNVTIINAVVHPMGMILIPLCAVLFVPLPPVYAFFHSLTFTADGKDPSLRRNIYRAAGLAHKWYGTNLSFLFVLKLFTFFVYVNWMIMISSLPSLAGSLLGLDIAKAQAADFIFNTTFQASVVMLTWFCVSPIVRAAYALRCFYGESVSSGEDLKAELKFIRSAGLRAALAGFALMLFAGPPVSAADASPDSQRTKELNRKIDDVLKRAEFSWRAPREPVEEQEDGMTGRMSQSIVDLLAKVTDAALDLLRDFVEWLFEKTDEDEPVRDNDGAGINWGNVIDLAMWTLMVAAAIALIFLGVRLWGQRPATVALAEPVIPDLTAEDVTADELPEDEWLALAHDLLNKGDSRLALRALYLACLAHLGERELVTISRAKSNREYQRELHRRARLLEDLRQAFGENVLAFERVWYGVHEVSRVMFDHFEQNLHRIRQC